MNKNLPNVYAVPITKKLQNNKETYKSFELEDDMTRSNRVTIDDINKIFNAKTHVYKTRVKLNTTKGVLEEDIVGLTGDSLLTLKGDTIRIDDILSIKKV